METVLNWVAAYGYAAIFLLLTFGVIGLPVPDEWLLVFTGYLVYAGRLHPAGAFASALLGSVSGISCSYLLGRKLGLPLLHSKFGRYAHITDEHIRTVHNWFDRIGHWALVIGYFIPGVRHFTALVAGTSCLAWRSFALYAYTGAVLWVSTFLFIGYHFGEQWKITIVFVEKNLKLASLAAGACIAGYLIFRYVKKKKFTRPASP